MPKQADIRVQVPCCTAAHFWNVVYEKPEATERYHTNFNSSTSTSVTPWVSCQRTVNFTMPLRLPDFLKRTVGLDSVAVTEVQRVVWHGGGSFTVSSETSITNMMGAGRFTTALQLTVTEQPQPAEPQPAAAAPPAPTGQGAPGGDRTSGCGGSPAAAAAVQLVYGVRCAAASIPWPMSATIENVMSEKALVSMQTFLDFCTQLLLEAEEEQHAAVQTAAAAAAAAGAAGATGAPADAAVAPPSAAAAGAALLEPAARLSDSGTATGGPWVAVAGSAAAGDGSAAAAPLLSGGGLSGRISLRHRWPSITCSQEIGGVGGGGVGVGGVSASGVDPFLLRRQDTGGDVFWDAPETFGAAGCGSGVSSGAVSPRQLLLQSGSLRRRSADCATTAPGTNCGGGAAAATAATAAASASAVAVSAVASETHQVAVAVDRLSAAVATLDGKVGKMLLLQEQQQQTLMQQLQDLQHQLHRQQQQQQLQQQGATPDYLLDRPRRGSGGGGSDGGGGSGSDVRWMFRVTMAVAVATLLVMAYWVLHPLTTGFRPGGGAGGGGSGGGGTAPPASIPLVSVLRLDGAAAAGGSLSGGSGSGGSSSSSNGGGGMETAREKVPRLALQVLGRQRRGRGKGDGVRFDEQGGGGGGGSQGARFRGGGGGGGGGGGEGRRRRRQHGRQKPQGGA
ncbi:hypothetical protein PLESTB_001455300 [Pleodorina starrii]|uniref:VASt domain-containing protein n=1 Tax=Pleodorina starrii TaxID=330485 RepID=A0A9W6BVH2_9CHLO|nr:hypothetical protein PLESTM_000770300 [Pleodorina starrii]GLC59164.1 hypothetical protein PLESTB_001455300 [Pleodorina starrii]